MKTRLKGGTGWTVQMAMDAGTKDVFLFDTHTRQWYRPVHHRWDDHGHWVKEMRLDPVGGYPTLHNHSAVVGSRQIDYGTERRIEELFHRSIRFAHEVHRMNIAFQGLLSLKIQRI